MMYYPLWEIQLFFQRRVVVIVPPCWWFLLLLAVQFANEHCSLQLTPSKRSQYHGNHTWPLFHSIYAKKVHPSATVDHKCRAGGRSDICFGCPVLDGCMSGKTYDRTVSGAARPLMSCRSSISGHYTRDLGSELLAPSAVMRRVQLVHLPYLHRVLGLHLQVSSRKCTMSLA